MAAVLPEPHLEVLDELHPAPTPGEDEEVIDLHAPDAPAAPAAPAAVVKAPAAPAAPAPAEEDDLPADLRGKSPKELAKMYREAQSVIGRQGSELGEYRKRFDRVLEASFARQQAPVAPAAPAAPVEIDESEFFRQPRETISKAIENHPIIQEIKRTLGQSAADSQTQRAVANAEKFHTAHPDAGDIMADPDFQRWVGASRVRTALLSRADKQFDFDAGDEVFGTWKALKGKVAPAAPAAPVAPAAPAADDVSAAARTLAAAKRKQQSDAASVPTGGNGTPAKGAKKIYRRADVLKLMETDPDRYEQMAPEIEAAYREGRVR